MSLTTYNYNSVGGKIYYSGLTYTVTTGSYAIGKSGITRAETRAYWQYDTSGLGGLGVTNSDITYVEAKFVAAQAQPTPNSDASAIYFGSWVGASLDSSDWGGGTNMQIDWIGWFSSEEWFDLGYGGVDPIPLVNCNGTTDISQRDTSSTPGTAFNFEGKSKSQIRITYTIPAKMMTRTLLGAGLCVLGWIGVHWTRAQLWTKLLRLAGRKPTYQRIVFDSI